MSSLETSSAETEVDAEVATSILGGAIETQENQGIQTIQTFTSGVEREVKNITSTLEFEGQETQISFVTTLDHMTHEYVSDRRDTLGVDNMVGDTASEGAAAWYDLRKDQIVFDSVAMSSEIDAEYWARVRKHEEIHEQLQAKEFKLSEIKYNNITLSVNPVLVEWQACKANIPSDLTPEYKGHVAAGDALVEFLGSEEPLVTALKTGDMQALQTHIDQLQIEQILWSLQPLELSQDRATQMAA